MSDVTTPSDLIDATEEKIYRLYRDRIVHEDNLINHRMMWLVLSQAFMLVLWGGSFKEFSGGATIESVLVLWIISVFGGSFAFGSKMAIGAAQSEINELRDAYMLFYPRPKDAADDPKISEISWMETLRLKMIGQKPVKDTLLTAEQRLAKSIPTLSTRNDILPRLTGRKHFHEAGHLMPWGMPWFLVALWIFLAIIALVHKH